MVGRLYEAARMRDKRNSTEIIHEGKYAAEVPDRTHLQRRELVADDVVR